MTNQTHFRRPLATSGMAALSDTPARQTGLHWGNTAHLRNAASAGALLVCVATAFAADIPADSVKLAPGVAKEPGYETPPTSYIVANPTKIYSDHSFYDTKVTGELKRGDHVDGLAKVKGYDWLLVGKDGVGIGYVSISMLSPADKYIP